MYGAANSLSQEGYATGGAGALNQAIAGNTAASQAGQLGLGALSGNQADYQALSNPWTQSVINAMTQQYGLLSKQVANQVDSQATLQGGLGGSGQAVGLGSALSELGLGENTQMAQLLSQGYTNAMGQAQALAGYGQNANSLLAGNSAYQQSQATAAQNHQLASLIAGMQGAPVTQTSTQSASGNPWNAILGAGLTIGGGLLGGPAGASLGSQLGGAASGLANTPSDLQNSIASSYGSPYGNVTTAAPAPNLGMTPIGPAMGIWG